MSEKESTVRVAITCGDLNGIGLEVVLKTLSDNRIYQTCTPIIYCSAKAVAAYRKTLSSLDMTFHVLKPNEPAAPHKLNLVNCWEEEVTIEPGIANESSARHAYRSFEMAMADLQAGNADVLITAPVNKQTVAQTGISFSGHTESLAEKFGSEDYLMLLVSGSLRIGVVTGHIPLQQVATSITTDKIIRKAKTMHDSLRRDFGITTPRIAILGLNPHAGDNGLLGKEEQDIIAPAVKKLMDSKIYAFGPFSADGFFGSDAFTRFDGILAMYHDQGLVPFKSMAFDTGVNFTAGLQIVRTSPDHGPAFDIAGKDIASESSFREAFYAAQDIYHKRADFRDISKSPLPAGLTRHGSDN